MSVFSTVISMNAAKTAAQESCLALITSEIGRSGSPWLAVEIDRRGGGNTLIDRRGSGLEMKIVKIPGRIHTVE